MSALSEFVLRHKVVVILFWLAVFACGVFASSEVGERTAREEWAEHQRRASALFERLTEEDKRELLRLLDLLNAELRLRGASGG